MTIPLTLPDWVVWKLSARDGTTYCFSESALVEDAAYDLEKKTARSLPKVLKAMIADGTVRRVADGVVLSGRERYTPVKVSEPVSPLDISAETRALQDTLRASSRAVWRASPETFWVRDDAGKVRLGAPTDVQVGRTPICFSSGEEEMHGET